jgi:hypothetical protein
MKVIVEFDSHAEALVALRATDYLIAAEQFASYLRQQLKYADHPDREINLLENVQARFYEEFQNLIV